VDSQWQIESLALKSRHALEVHGTDDVKIPFTVLVGKKLKPAALIMAGVHGDEYEGPAAILDLVEEINPAALEGSIIFVPFANPEAFAATSRRHPADNGDLNRSFPGEPQGKPTMRLAHLLVSEFVSQADCIFSLHGWGKEALVHPYVEYPAGDSETARTSRQAALASGFEYVYPYLWPKGVLGNYALQRGIPILEGEIGGMATITPHGQKLYHDAILRFLAHFNIFQFQAEVSRAQHGIHVVHHQEIRASQNGLFQSRLTVGDAVSAGETLGVIRGLNGVHLVTLQAPCAGMVGVMRTLSSVTTGDMLFHLFIESEEE
jgi:predicted deacylase